MSSARTMTMFGGAAALPTAADRTAKAASRTAKRALFRPPQRGPPEREWASGRMISGSNEREGFMGIDWSMAIHSALPSPSRQESSFAPADFFDHSSQVRRRVGGLAARLAARAIYFRAAAPATVRTGSGVGECGGGGRLKDQGRRMNGEFHAPPGRGICGGSAVAMKGLRSWGCFGAGRSAPLGQARFWKFLAAVISRAALAMASVGIDDDEVAVCAGDLDRPAGGA